MRKYRVYLSYSDYRGERQKLNGELMDWIDIQRLIGEKLLECNSAKQVDANGYVFYGQYQAAGGQIETMTYNLEFIVDQ